VAHTGTCETCHRLLEDEEEDAVWEQRAAWHRHGGCSTGVSRGDGGASSCAPVCHITRGDQGLWGAPAEVRGWRARFGAGRCYVRAASPPPCLHPSAAPCYDAQPTPLLIPAAHQLPRRRMSPPAMLVPTNPAWSPLSPSGPHHPHRVPAIPAWSPPTLPGPHCPCLVPTIPTGSPPSPPGPHRPCGAGLALRRWQRQPVMCPLRGASAAQGNSERALPVTPWVQGTTEQQNVGCKMAPGTGRGGERVSGRRRETEGGRKPNVSFVFNCNCLNLLLLVTRGRLRSPFAPAICSLSR